MAIEHDDSSNGPSAPLSQEACHALGEEIATFATRADVVMHAMLTRLRRFDAAEGWGIGGFVSCAHWLAWRTHIGLKTAREQVRVARALGELPIVDAAFGRGELSYSKVRAITRVASADNEPELIDIAMHSTASQLERLLRAYGRCLEAATEEPQELRGARRHVYRSETVDGMVRIEIVLPPEEAAIVWDAIEAAMDTARGTGQGPTTGDPGAQGPIGPDSVVGDSASADSTNEDSPTEELADCDAATGDPSAEGPAACCAAEAASAAACQASAEAPMMQLRADAIVDVARAYLQHRPRTLGSAYELVVVTTKEQLETGPGGIGGFLRDGSPIPLHIARMLANDGARVDVVVGEHGELLDVGRRTRVIPAAIGRALWLRDGGCRVPGCGRTRHMHAHHIQGWAEGGPTRLANLLLVCSTHHRMIHEGTLAVEIRAKRVVFLDRRGREIPRFPARVASLDELEHYLHEADLHIDPSLTEPKWDGRPMELLESLAWLLGGGGKAPPRKPGVPKPGFPKKE